ncbi:MAG: hypothetical protein ACK5RC_12575 [Curvibacter sp.]|nr:hypothetical protein [Curvibacter sp.]
MARALCAGELQLLIAQLNRALNEVLQAPEISPHIQQDRTPARSSTPGPLAQHVWAELDRWQAVVRVIGLGTSHEVLEAQEMGLR